MSLLQGFECDKCILQISGPSSYTTSYQWQNLFTKVNLFSMF